MRRIVFSACLLLFLGNIYVWSTFLLAGSGELEIDYLDVGQGDAILITAPNGHHVLVDGGPGKNILTKVAEELPFFTHEIDLLIETHPDTDHVAGLADISERYQFFGLLKPCIKSDNSYDAALNQVAESKDVPIVCAKSGQIIDLGSGVKIEILYAGDMSSIDTNSASIIMRVIYNQSKFLFTGDSTEQIEKYLVLKMPEKLSSDVYKVSHHGSRLSNDPQFISAIQPSIAVISVGIDNRYGHPHKEVIEMLTAKKIKILRTDESGTIYLRSDGKNIYVE